MTVIFAVCSIIIICMGLLYIRNRQKYSNQQNITRYIPNNIIFRLPGFDYYSSEYYKQTKLSYNAVQSDKGRKGEYDIYRILSNYENAGCKFLFNCYLNREDGRTTELDVIMITAKAIFVFESKNYKGWIFGDENDQYWTQCLANKKKSVKEKFYNPIKQNATHINVLRNYINEVVPIYNMVVFSDTATLKEVAVRTTYTKVINIKELEKTVGYLCDISTGALAENLINDIYNKLFPFTQVTHDIKEKHVNNINSMFDNNNRINN